MVGKYLKLNDLSAYTKSFSLSDKIWNLVISMDSLAKHTIGEQFIRAIDSISANIAEGFGRFHRKDKIKFYYNARGSIYESLDWLEKCKHRKLVTEKQYQEIFEILIELPKEVNSLIKFTGEKLKT